jgi:hypothetical protein
MERHGIWATGGYHANLEIVPMSLPRRKESTRQFGWRDAC